LYDIILILTLSPLLSYYQHKILEVMMATIKQILDNKGHEIYSISSKQTVFAALQLMAEKGIGALPVFEGNSLVGIISERDYARKIILKDKMSRETLVEEIMTKEVI